MIKRMLLPLLMLALLSMPACSKDPADRAPGKTEGEPTDKAAKKTTPRTPGTEDSASRAGEPTYDYGDLEEFPFPGQQAYNGCLGNSSKSP